MTPRERAEKLAGPRPCNYGRPGDDAAEILWFARVTEIEAAIVEQVESDYSSNHTSKETK